MNYLLLQGCVLIPLLGFLISMLIPRKKETFIFWISAGTVLIHFVCFLVYTIFWLQDKLPLRDYSLVSTGFNLFEHLYFDKLTLVFSLVGAVLAFMVIVFSRYYIHREPGFKRFFNVLLFFYLGYNLVVFAGDMELLFIGWEILGVCSFLLISFYRDRYLPVKNALKVISIFILGDMFLTLLIWMSHHLWGASLNFSKFNSTDLMKEYLQYHNSYGLYISILIVLAAAVKSAQMPFSTWLPRAMEGPTTSSAIFYGSLSVHLGVFLLLRTYPFWDDLPLIKLLIVLIGLITSLVAAGISRVQSSVKTQIAYSSIAQIGLMFIEVALGFHTLALIHFAGNAFLRTYQLLISPSVLSYLIHNQFYHFDPNKLKIKNNSFAKIKNTFYILCIKEWNLDFSMYRYVWSPFKWVGNKLNFSSKPLALSITGLIFLGGILCFYLKPGISNSLAESLPVIFSVMALIFALVSFSKRDDAIKAWFLIFVSQLFIALSVMLNEEFEQIQVLIFIGSAGLSAFAGFLCLTKINQIDGKVKLNQYHGYVYEKPGIAFVFLLAVLGLLGIPITPSFIGIDLMYTHIHSDQIVLLITTSLNFIFIELAVLRIYARVFLGQHKKAYHPIAFKSS